MGLRGKGTATDETQMKHGYEIFGPGELVNRLVNLPVSSLVNRDGVVVLVRGGNQG